jgi:outer membrane biogenesis lipoprotein LolB
MPLPFAGMQESLRSQLTPGTRVRVTQQIAARDRTWTSEVRGTVVSYDQQPTGSWYAHSKGDKLWLDRLKLRKEDGELITLVLDEFSHIDTE